MLDKLNKAQGLSLGLAQKTNQMCPAIDWGILPRHLHEMKAIKAHQQIPNMFHIIIIKKNLTLKLNIKFWAFFFADSPHISELAIASIRFFQIPCSTSFLKRFEWRDLHLKKLISDHSDSSTSLKYVSFSTIGSFHV